MEKQRYLIYSFEHSGWWKPREMGYGSIKEAGDYSYQDALRIVSGANINFNRGSALMPNEAMVPLVPGN